MIPLSNQSLVVAGAVEKAENIDCFALLVNTVHHDIVLNADAPITKCLQPQVLALTVHMQLRGRREEMAEAVLTKEIQK